jgi:NADPH:quinone reductase-like Zn-dependent oxidoreductase
MKNLLVFYDKQKNFKTELEDIPVPSSELKPNDVLIKVSIAGSNPKDWKHPLPEYFNNKLNMGDDCVG